MNFATERLIGYVLVILVLLVLILGMIPGGFIREALEKNPTDLLPSEVLDKENGAGGKVMISEDHRVQAVSLQETISRMLASSKKACFDTYSTFSALGETSVSVGAQSSGSGSVLVVKAGAGGRQVVTDLMKEYPTLNPCVVSGEVVVSNFGKHYFSGNGMKGAGDFEEVSSLTLREDDGGYLGSTKNRINFGSGVLDFVDGGVLYKPDESHVCFFATVSGEECEYDSTEGVSQGCLFGSSSSISRGLSNGVFTRC